MPNVAACNRAMATTLIWELAGAPSATIAARTIARRIGNETVVVRAMGRATSRRLPKCLLLLQNRRRRIHHRSCRTWDAAIVIWLAWPRLPGYG